MSAKPKVVIAAMILLFGVVGALCFRKTPPPHAEAPPAAQPAAPAPAPLRPAAQPPAEPHLLGRIDPVEVTEGQSPPAPPAPTTQNPNLEDPYQEMPSTPPWSGFEHDNASIDARMASIRAPESAGAPAEARPPRRRTHRVSDGDTLTSLALRYLGRSDRYQEIYAANTDVLTSPDVLPIGKILQIPDPGAIPPDAPVNHGPMVDIPSDVLRAARDATAPPAPATDSGARTYRVQAQDTLSGIARQFYGDAARYHDLLSANADKLRSANDLREGMVLIVP